jgi:AraC-like DNA-binding protein
VQRDASLSEVALEFGFSSPGNFSRFFREHMGTTISLPEGGHWSDSAPPDGRALNGILV